MTNYIKTLPKDAVAIKGTVNWVDKKGNIYGIETRMVPCRFDKNKFTPHKHYGEYFKYRTFVNNHNGYVYCSIKYIIDEEKKIYQNRQRRVHILVAETFIENPNNYFIVGHRNNIKNDNRVENLYWTTPQENTQKAVNDGLLVNDKGYDDSQSNPVIMFDTYTNEELGRYGSITIASEETGIGKNTISRQAKYKKPVRKPFYFRFQDDPSVEPPKIIIQYDFETQQELRRYYNANEAQKITGIPSKTIFQQCQNNKKPKWTKNGSYFLFSK